MTKTYLAIGIGVSSGRHILDWEEYCRRSEVPEDGEWLARVLEYEKTITEARA